jgi:hypothetical protein
MMGHRVLIFGQPAESREQAGVHRHLSWVTPRRQRLSTQRWATFVRNHAHAHAQGEHTMNKLTASEGRELAKLYPLARVPPHCNQVVRTTLDDNAPVRFTCTRNPGHEGPHVAHANEGIAVATWE